MYQMLYLICFSLLLSLTEISSAASETRIAVASNFAATIEEIGRAFEKETGHKALFSFASTGQLYTQIIHGAPYDAFLAADILRPQKLVDAKLANSASLMTYAAGKLALYTKRENFALSLEALQSPQFRKVAIANPLTAPYGAAAQHVLEQSGIYNTLQDRLVQGINIAQTYQFVYTDNAQVGFVALSQVINGIEGSYWPVPEALYPTIAQGAVLLKRGEGNPATLSFMTFLQSQTANHIKAKFGYGTGGS